MSTTGVRPKSAGVVFAQRAALQQHLAGPVPDDDGKSPVKRTLPVGCHFARRAGLPIVGIDQHDLFRLGPFIKLHRSLSRRVKAA
jgi:hypothetical protein